MEPTDINRLLLCGIAEEAPAFSHAVRDEAFFHLPLAVTRRSGTIDRLPVTVPERLLAREIAKGAWLRVEGQLRTYDRYDEAGRHLLVTAYARRLEPLPPPGMAVSAEFCPEAPAGDAVPSTGTENEVLLTGTVCRIPVYRVTPLMREIADVLLCCERAFGRRDYLPVIVWGALARSAAHWTPGRRIQVRGRFQSRAYEKLLPGGKVEQRVAYEVSAAAAHPLP